MNIYPKSNNLSSNPPEWQGWSKGGEGGGGVSLILAIQDFESASYSTPSLRDLKNMQFQNPRIAHLGAECDISVTKLFQFIWCYRIWYQKLWQQKSIGFGFQKKPILTMPGFRELLFQQPLLFEQVDIIIIIIIHFFPKERS